MGEQRPHLDPIQEESEREDEFERSDTGEEEEEEKEENGEVMAEDGSEEESEGCSLLRLLRPRRRSRLSEESSLVQSTENNRQEEAELSESDGITHTPGGPSVDSTPPRQTRSGDELRLMKMKVSLLFSGL